MNQMGSSGPSSPTAGAGSRSRPSRCPSDHSPCPTLQAVHEDATVHTCEPTSPTAGYCRDDTSVGPGPADARARTVGASRHIPLAGHNVARLPLPAVPGHEVAGAVGLGPQATAFTVGDHVVGCLVQWCGGCPACRPYQCGRPQATLRDPEHQGPRLRAVRGGR
ncbi:alcohol dehydrogenase catalytic domain-containing protein [Streptomyces sp. NPDC058964]|uniref:alcohol dehydrogenase catalytic domain-containing protein n=1 Tax=Streptomyces sp. NPDC058964 TaxID=3346681 RepID=UPI003697D996